MQEDTQVPNPDFDEPDVPDFDDFSEFSEPEHNRRLVRALLALKRLTLMNLLAQRPKDFPENLDYGNASAWLRGVPGRLSVKKQRAILSLLGYDADYGFLNPAKPHFWYLTAREYDEDIRYLLEKLEVPNHCRLRQLRLPGGTALGWALKIKDATVFFPVTNEQSKADIEAWFEMIGLNLVKTLPEMEISRESWERCRKEGDIPNDLWDEGESSWKQVIKSAKAEGLRPEDVIAVIKAIRKTRRESPQEITLQDNQIIAILSKEQYEPLRGTESES